MTERVYTERGRRAHRNRGDGMTVCGWPIYAVDRYNDGREWDWLGHEPLPPATIRKLKQAATCYRCAES